MANFMLAVALFILASTALGLFRVLRDGAGLEPMMAVQLLGSGGAAVVVLLAASTGEASIADVGLVLGLLAAFASVAFALGAAGPAGPAGDGPAGEGG